VNEIPVYSLDDLLALIDFRLDEGDPLGPAALVAIRLHLLELDLRRESAVARRWRGVGIDRAPSNAALKDPSSRSRHPNRDSDS
jgi:hypothetical protein